MTAFVSNRRNIVVLLVVVLFFLIVQVSRSSQSFALPRFRQSPAFVATQANATLGFGTIIVISSENTSDPFAWRQSGIVAAANLTGIELNIAPHNEPSFKTIKALQTEGDGDYHPKDNASLAWFAHLDALESFVDSPYETALVLEDDADWDVSVRETLASDSPVVDAIRNLTESKLDRQQYYYGLNWDLLWLGHCGYESYPGSSNITVPNTHVLPPSRMRAVLGEPKYRKLAPNTCEVSFPAAPMCTFAYAVTKVGARKLLERRHKGGKGMDFSTSVGCHEELRCLSTMPEMFHHHRKIGGGFKPQIQREGTAEEAQQKLRSFTHNIVYSARCNALNRPAGPDSVGTVEDEQWNDLVQCLPSEEDWKKYNG